MKLRDQLSFNYQIEEIARTIALSRTNEQWNERAGHTRMLGILRKCE